MKKLSSLGALIGALLIAPAVWAQVYGPQCPSGKTTCSEYCAAKYPQSQSRADDCRYSNSNSGSCKTQFETAAEKAGKKYTDTCVGAFK